MRLDSIAIKYLQLYTVVKIDLFIRLQFTELQCDYRESGSDVLGNTVFVLRDWGQYHPPPSASKLGCNTDLRPPAVGPYCTPILRPPAIGMVLPPISRTQTVFPNTSSPDSRYSINTILLERNKDFFAVLVAMYPYMFTL